MADHLSLDTIFSCIDEINSADPKIRCLGVTIKGYQCSRSITLKPDALRALKGGNATSHRARDSSTARTLRFTFDKLVESCCCWQHKPKFHANTDLGQRMRSEWQRDADLSTPEHSTPEHSTPEHPASTSCTSGNAHDRSPTEASHKKRYNLRSMPHDTSSVAEGSDHAEAEEFVPMVKPRQTLRQKLIIGPYGKQMRETGALYAFWRASDQGKLKIGHSKRVVTRLDAWRRSCHYEPILKHHIENVPYAKFAEGLIHYELLPHWRREVRCRHNAACQKQHREWFQIDDATAFRVMDNWAKWIRVAEPYDERHELKGEWRAIIESMEESGIQVTSQGLLDAMESLQVDDTVPNNDSGTATATEPFVEGTPQPVVDTTISEPIADATEATSVLSAIADLIFSLTPAQTQELREFLDQGMRRRSLVSLPPATLLVPAV